MTPEDIRFLEIRRDRVLNALRVLSEARAAGAMRPDRGGRPSGYNSAPPPGVDFGRLRSQAECPDKDRSLFDFYAWHFARARAQDPTELATLCFLAERDLERRQRTGESTESRHRARNRSILSSKYVDQKPEVVAAIEECTEAHVRKWRTANGLDSKTGRPVRTRVA